VRRGASASRDPAVAASELASALAVSEGATAMFFASPSYDLEALGNELQKRFEGVELVGCTTAGEISPEGYARDSLVGMSFSASEFVAVVEACDDLRPGSITQFEISNMVRSLRRKLKLRAPAATSSDTFALLLIDGLAGLEESVLNSIALELGSIPLVGGSAGDALRFGEAVVFHAGAFRNRRAVLVLVHTALPFEVFRTQHVTRSGTNMVVTEADPLRRVVTEINAEPAVEEYARQLGITNRELVPAVLATHPVVVHVGGGDYARSIRQANPDGSLSFYCAIDEGIVLTPASGNDMVADLERLFAQIRRKIGQPAAVLGFDCVFRRLEIEDRRLESAVSRVLAANNTIGFSTYGEQFDALHLNQTFTGVAFGSSK